MRAGARARAVVLATVLGAALVAMTVLAALLTAQAPQGPLTLTAFGVPAAVALAAVIAVAALSRGRRTPEPGHDEPGDHESV
ncbi:hypothetical protein [Mycolicibacterium palauense]|uniref:hypothetical protein n=1 Tax=Mycolicibacterium palauense TaxID=2034511 RepID=UPI001145E15B|nr:hypothetical protein [Mycolicibacterium palauense]